MTIRLYINNYYERQERCYIIKGVLLHWEDKKLQTDMHQMSDKQNLRSKQK